MTPSSAIASFLCCLLLAAAASATPEEICKNVQEKEPSVDYDFCVRILKTDPASATADERHAAAIAGDLGYTQAETTLSKIDAFLKFTTSAAMAASLNDCKELYDDAMTKLLDAAKAVTEGDFLEANLFFSSGIDAAETCTEGFEQKKVRSPLKEDDVIMRQICLIGTAVTYTGEP